MKLMSVRDLRNRVEVAARTARAQLALSRMRRRAARTGRSRLTAEEVDAEIKATQRERRR
jgi:hypothetical protein